MIETDSLIDSLTDLIIGLDEDGHPPLAWVIRWSEGGRDPVHAAWDVAESPHSMVTVVRLGWGADHGAALKAIMVAAVQEVADGVSEVMPPGGWPVKPAPTRRARQHRQKTGAEFVRDMQRYMSTTVPLFPPPHPTEISWSLPGIAGRSTHGPMRLRYAEATGEKLFERVQDETGGYHGARHRLEHRVAVARIRQKCPVPPTLEDILRRASAVLT